VLSSLSVAMYVAVTGLEFLLRRGVVH
jgi:hypothetical protein